MTLLAGPPPAIAQVTLTEARFIQTTPFVNNATAEMRDNEGMAYVPVNNTIWLTDDNMDRAWEVNKDTGHVLSWITQTAFAATRRYPAGPADPTADTPRSADIESVAYDPNNDILYIFNGNCCPTPPAVYRLVRTTPGNPASPFRVESWQPLPTDIDSSGSAFHIQEGKLYLTSKSDIRPYDFVTNTVGPAVSMEKRGGSIYGMGFTPDGTKLWIVNSRGELYRLNWATKTIDSGTVFSMPSRGIADARSVEYINGQLFVGDGSTTRSDDDPRRLAVTVFNTGETPPPPPPTPPAAPTGLVATGGEAVANLSWTDNATNEAQFKIERCADAGCTDFGQIATVAANVTTYANTGLASGMYRYRVRASNAAGDSAFSNIADAVVTVPPPPATPPAAPTGLVATGGDAVVNLSWTDNSATETEFRIERCTPAGCTEFGQIATVGANVTTYSNTGLVNGQSYSYRVRAANSAGASGPSNVASATPLPPAPAAPSGLVATAATTGAALSWTDNATNETGFQVERCPGVCLGGAAGWGPIASPGPRTGTGTTSYTDATATSGTYSYRVQAVNIGGASAYSNIDDILVGPPPAPSALTATGVTSTAVALAWTDNSPNESGFEIERCTGAGCTDFAQIATVGADIRSFSDGGVAATTTYSYRMRATNAAGDSDYTAPAEATTPARTNLIANMSFELDANADNKPDVWSTSSKFTRSPAGFGRTGTYAGRLMRTGDVDGITIKQLVGPLTAGNTYSFSGCVNIPASAGVTFFWELKWRNASAVNILTDTFLSIPAPTTGWDCRTATFTAPATATQVDVRFGVTPGTYDIYLDDVIFE